MTPIRWALGTLAVGVAAAFWVDGLLLPITFLAALLWWGEVQSR